MSLAKKAVEAADRLLEFNYAGGRQNRGPESCAEDHTRDRASPRAIAGLGSLDKLYHVVLEHARLESLGEGGTSGWHGDGVASHVGILVHGKQRCRCCLW